MQTMSHRGREVLIAAAVGSTVEMIDQWYGADYRHVKVKASDSGIYILRFDEIRDEWTLIMFVSARAVAG